MIKGIEKGTELRLFQVPEGNYCAKEFIAYGRLFQYYNRNMCFFVEEGEINYAGHYVFRAQQTTSLFAENVFINSLKKQYPKICQQFLGSVCHD